MSLPRIPFGFVCHLVNGKAFKPTDWSGAGVPIIRIQNLNGSDKPFNYWAGTLDKQILVKTGDLLLAWSGTPGTSFGAHIWNGPKGILNQHIFRCDLDQKAITKEWARIAVNHRLDRLIEQAHGGVGLQHVTRGMVEELEIPLPPLPEQRRIAGVLDLAEALRTLRRAALAQLDSLTQSLFLDLFGDDTTILDQWPTRRLGDLLDFLTSGSRGWAEYYSDSGDLFLRIQNVRRDELILADAAYVRAPNTAEAKRTRVQAGDVLLSITADLGRTAVVPDGLGPAYINQHLSILRTKGIVPRFLSAYFNSPVGKRQVSRRNRQAVKAGLNFDDIRSFVIPIPPIGLQREFERRVRAVDKLRTMQRASLAEMDALFASLQHRAFRGEL